MTAALTPGAYLRKRREAHGLSVVDVAERIATTPPLAEHARVELIELIEADQSPARFSTIAAMHRAYRFDWNVLARLDAIAQGADFLAPTLCIDCACSQDDACFDRGTGCAWATFDPPRCTVCARERRAASTGESA